MNTLARRRVEPLGPWSESPKRPSRDQPKPKPKQDPNQYPAWLVARVKGLLACGLTMKGASRLTGIPYTTLVDWKSGRRCKSIPPDPDMKKALQELIG